MHVRRISYQNNSLVRKHGEEFEHLVMMNYSSMEKCQQAKNIVNLRQASI
jgi:hypothetical protein